MLTIVLLAGCPAVYAQVPLHDPLDRCGWLDTTNTQYRLRAESNWGYGYDSLLVDIGRWEQSPYATIDSVGASVQGRTLFRLTIRDPLSDPFTPKPRVWIHARTHPQEVEGTHVTNEMIRILLEEQGPGKSLREKFIFSVIPMYNPDGVELSYGRRNANGIDIESNWNSPAPEPEVQVLRGQFEQMMASSEPIRVALNMHSSSRGKRFFVFHSPVGTSELYADLERTFVQYVRERTPGRIEPWDYFVTWTLATALQYPESWFWLNHAESVMALTYEDIFGVTNGGFDSTAMGLLMGVNDYLLDPTTGIQDDPISPQYTVLEQNYPNPFNGVSTINFILDVPGDITLLVYDMMGREVARLADGLFPAGTHARSIGSDQLASGVYVYRLRTSRSIHSRMLTVLR
jgi:hypothetical protein